MTSTYAQKLAANIYPPGFGGIALASATSQYGIFLDNCTRATVQRLKVKDVAFDGLVVGSPDILHIDPMPPHELRGAVGPGVGPGALRGGPEDARDAARQGAA